MQLTAAEARVLGCLIERAALEPASYPVTLNRLRLACNQSEGRNPAVAYDDRTVEDTLLALKSKGLARFLDPLRGERTTRYSHRADHRWRLSPAELAVLSVLLVGGPMTLAEVEARARRLHDFGPSDEIVAVLDALAARTPTPFATRLGGLRASDTRWVQALTDTSVSSGDESGEHPPAGPRAAVAGAEPTSVPSYAELAARVAELERRLVVAGERPGALAVVERLAALERRLARVEAELGALR
jgi:uncharacterized protein YceH (UPF0502 family)